MKTRDMVKYALASLIAGATIAAIAVMEVVRHQRAARGQADRPRIEQVFQENRVEGALPVSPADAPRQNPPAQATRPATH